VVYKSDLKINDDGRECTDCKEYKPWDEYHAHPNGPHDKNTKCKVCLLNKRKEDRGTRPKPPPRAQSMSPKNMSLQDSCNSNWDANGAAAFLARKR